SAGPSVSTGPSANARASLAAAASAIAQSAAAIQARHGPPAGPRAVAPADRCKGRSPSMVHHPSPRNADARFPGRSAFVLRVRLDEPPQLIGELRERRRGGVARLGAALRLLRGARHVARPAGDLLRR